MSKMGILLVVIIASIAAISIALTLVPDTKNSGQTTRNCDQVCQKQKNALNYARQLQDESAFPTQYAEDAKLRFSDCKTENCVCAFYDNLPDRYDSKAKKNYYDWVDTTEFSKAVYINIVGFITQEYSSLNRYDHQGNRYLQYDRKWDFRRLGQFMYENAEQKTQKFLDRQFEEGDIKIRCENSDVSDKRRS
jgi:hypothetical protein